VDKGSVKILNSFTPYQRSLVEAMLSGTYFGLCTYVLEVQISLLEMLEAFVKLDKLDADNGNAHV
jgi:hypothetical protein